MEEKGAWRSRTCPENSQQNACCESPEQAGLLRPGLEEQPRDSGDPRRRGEGSGVGGQPGGPPPVSLLPRAPSPSERPPQDKN